MKTFFSSNLFKFLFPLFAYLLLVFHWIYNYMAVWYSNIPEETQYFLKGSNMGFYVGYAYVFIICFIIFIIFGIIYLTRKRASKFINYILIGILFLSAFFVWHFSITMNFFNRLGIINFIILVLFAVSIFNLSKKEQQIERR